MPARSVIRLLGCAGTFALVVVNLANNTQIGSYTLKELSGGSSPQPSSPTAIYVPRTLPVRNETGLIVVFVHIPKTGGTSIRANIKPFVKSVTFVWGSAKYHKSVRSMDNMLRKWKRGNVVFWELHTGDAWPYMSFRDKLQAWRQAAAAQGVPFFAFTVVREPVSFAVSFFNYYHGLLKGKGFFKYVKNADETTFRQYTVANPQCLFLSRSELAYTDRLSWLRHGIEKSECDRVYESISTDLDWVGTTENLSTETLPLLSSVLRADINWKSKNTIPDRHQTIKKSKLQNSTIEFLQNMTAFDRDIFERAKADFPIDMWEKNGSKSLSLT